MTVEDWIDGRNVLVTGGTGSIGTAIVDRIMKHNPEAVRVLSNDEHGLFAMQQRSSDPRLRFLLGDVRDERRMEHAMQGIDVVYHCAALKHVPLCEYNPFEALQTNVMGTRNCIGAAHNAGVQRLVLVSTDKAVNPTNTMGATKFLAERLIIDAANYTGHRGLVASCVRFGNVLYSRGSVLETFSRQVLSGGPVTVTDPNMTRFFMPISRAADLTFEATAKAQGGEIFIFKMPMVQVGELAASLQRVLAEEHAIHSETEVTGTRPGEKLHEELMTSLEAQHALETEDMFIVIPERYRGREYPGAEGIRQQGYASRDGPFLEGKDLDALVRAAREEAEPALAD